jgi:hypothetical protein
LNLWPQEKPLTAGPDWLHTFPVPPHLLKEIQKKRYSTIMKRIIGNFVFWVGIKMLSTAAIHLVLDAFSLSPLSKIKIV